MTLHYSVLASGSTGNAMYIETEGQRLLIDCGLSGKKMHALLETIGKNPDAIDAILVTHEHSDHIKGLGAFSRRHKKPIYANTKTWHAMEPLIGDIPLDQKFIFETGTAKSFGDIDVESFGVSHDAAEPMFFNFRHNSKKLTLMTDLGYVSDRIKDAVKGADTYVIESNHDIQMLMMGRYPWNVKRRILGDSGHISNEDAGLALTEILDNNTSRIYLAHLSKDNNMKELAKMSVQQKLEQYGITIGHDRRLLDTDPEMPTVLDTL